MTRIRPRASFPGVRHLSLLADIDNYHSYLNYCNSKQISLTSSAVKGTLYEYTTKAYLSQFLNMDSLIRIGGANDGGIDIVGNWNLKNYINFPKLHKTKVNKRSLLHRSVEYNQFLQNEPSPNHISLENINVYVQCKNYDRKIGPQTIRELDGIYSYHIKSKSKKLSSIFFLVSPFPLTKQGQSQFDASTFPIIHCKLTPMKLLTTLNIYDSRNWNGDNLDTIYMNDLARIRLSGLNLELHFEALKKKSINRLHLWAYLIIRSQQHSWQLNDSCSTPIAYIYRYHNINKTITEKKTI